MCGEQHMPRWMIWSRRGSPPRVRGTAITRTCSRSAPRITPACAGNRRTWEKLTEATQDHPRVCGEQDAGYTGSIRVKGSPPRVRGTEVINEAGRQAYRITPACAGNRQAPRYAPPAPLDHPRVCGEQRAAAGSTARARGSPPRVRGTARISLAAGNLYRITPACAGNRRSCGPDAGAAEDHPRVCGEQNSPLDLWSQYKGSPPRVRGTAESC